MRDVLPSAATAAYAAPELLLSLLLQIEGADDDHAYMRINGAAADMWSIGVVMYHLLTGELPFQPDASAKPRPAPEYVELSSRDAWEDYFSRRAVFHTWVSLACRTCVCVCVCVSACSARPRISARQSWGASLCMLCGWTLLFRSMDITFATKESRMGCSV